MRFNPKGQERGTYSSHPSMFMLFVKIIILQFIIIIIVLSLPAAIPWILGNIYGMNKSCIITTKTSITSYGNNLSSFKHHISAPSLHLIYLQMHFIPEKKRVLGS